MGLFLHDMGKCEELKWETGFSYSEDGNLVGHIARGVIWLEGKAKQADAAGGPTSPWRLPDQPPHRVVWHVKTGASSASGGHFRQGATRSFRG
jgi:3'-5' exoribonuclease